LGKPGQSSKSYRRVPVRSSPFSAIISQYTIVRVWLAGVVPAQSSPSSARIARLRLFQVQLRLFQLRIIQVQFRIVFQAELEKILQIRPG
jgi:hypothetical protein